MAHYPVIDRACHGACSCTRTKRAPRVVRLRRRGSNCGLCRRRLTRLPGIKAGVQTLGQPTFI